MQHPLEAAPCAAFRSVFRALVVSTEDERPPEIGAFLCDRPVRNLVTAAAVMPLPLDGDKELNRRPPGEKRPRPPGTYGGDL